MVSTRLFAGICLIASVAVSVQTAAADTYKVILRGTVMMQDGSPPPKSVGIQRICSDSYGDAPGPITDKKGKFIWQMDVDNLQTRVCRLEATLGICVDGHRYLRPQRLPQYSQGTSPARAEFAARTRGRSSKRMTMCRRRQASMESRDEAHSRGRPPTS